MRRSGGPRRDGPGARAFNDRGRASSATSLRRSALRSPGGAGSRLPAPEPPELTMAEALRVRFKARTPARRERCVRCNRQAHSFHHWLPQAALRAFMRGEARRRSLEPAEVRVMLRVLLRARSNLSPCCATCHMALEAWMAGSGGRDGWRVPADAILFARELGPEWEIRLRRAYPAGVA